MFVRPDRDVPRCLCTLFARKPSGRTYVRGWLDSFASSLRSNACIGSLFSELFAHNLHHFRRVRLIA